MSWTFYNSENNSWNYIKCDYDLIISDMATAFGNSVLVSQSFGNPFTIAVLTDIINGDYSSLPTTTYSFPGGSSQESWLDYLHRQTGGLVGFRNKMLQIPFKTVGAFSPSNIIGAGAVPNNLTMFVQLYTTAFSAGSLNLNITIPPFITSAPTRQRTFQPPESGVLFSTSFFSDASLIAQDTGLDHSANVYWAQQIQDVSFSDTANKGITVITVQTISNETVGFTKYLGAHTLEFTNWDFSANDPSGEGNAVGVGYDGKNTIKSYDLEDSSANWDLSATMMVGIPTNLAHGSTTNVLFPVAIQSSTEPSYNVINHTDNSNTSFIDLYAVLGKPNLVNVKNAYDENLTAIDVSYVNFRSVNSASIIYVGPGIPNTLPFFNFYSDASGLVELYPPSGDVDTSLNRLVLVKNRPYTFKRIATDNDHPFIITNNALGIQPTQGTITTNSINDNGNKLISDESTLIINYTFSLNDTLTWYCTSHHNMNGTFDVI